MAIDVMRVRYYISAILPNGSVIDIPRPIIETASLEELDTELAVRYSMSLRNASTPFGLMNEVLALGVRLQVKSDWGEGPKEVWQGIVWSSGLQSSAGSGMRLQVTAYDVLRRLTQSRDDYLTNAGDDAMALLKQVLTDYEYRLGTVFSFGDKATLPAYKFTGSMAELVSTVFDVVYSRGAGEFYMRSRLGMVDILPPGQNSPIYYVDGRVAESWEDTEDISDLVTEVRSGSVTPAGPADDAPDHEAQPGEMTPNPSGQVAIGPYRQRIGKIRYVVNSNIQQNVDDPSALSDTVATILQARGEPNRTQRVTLPDLPFLRRGDLIHFHVGTLDGRYLVSGVSHDVAQHKMSVTVNNHGTLIYKRIKRQVAGANAGPADEDQSVRVRTFPEIPLIAASGGTMAVAAQATAEARSMEAAGVTGGDEEP
jgi:hypothetical protein